MRDMDIYVDAGPECWTEKPEKQHTINKGMYIKANRQRHNSNKKKSLKKAKKTNFGKIEIRPGMCVYDFFGCSFGVCALNA